MVDDGGRTGCAPCRRWSTTASARGARVDDGRRRRAHGVRALHAPCRRWSTTADACGRTRCAPCRRWSTVTLASRLRAINHSTPKWWPRSGSSERSCVRPLGCGGCVLRLGGEHRVFACCASQASTAGSRRTASPKRVPPALVLRRLGEQRLLPYRSLKVMGPAPGASRSAAGRPHGIARCG